MSAPQSQSIISRFTHSSFYRFLRSLIRPHSAKEDLSGFRDLVRKYTLLGVIFGFLFPIFSSLIVFYDKGLAPTLGGLLFIQRNEPLLWVIDTAPIFLGLFSFFIGKNHAKALYLIKDLKALRDALEQRIAERTVALEASAQALKASIQVSQRLNSILDPQVLAVSVVDEVKKAFGYYHVHIYLFDDTHENLVMVGGTGEPGEIMLRRGHKIPRGKGLVGRASEINRVIQVDDTSEDSGWLPNPLLPETQSEIAVPIASGNNVLGVLDVQENRKSGFSAQAVELLQAIANQTAIAVQNTRLYNMAQRKAEIETRASLISQRIQSATTIESVLQVVLRDLSEALSARRANVQIGLGSGNIKGQKQP
jgi:putative methionine-R-sulfoxide reductase with GAF domain